MMAENQLEFSLREETPFEVLRNELLDRTEGMFDLSLGMTLNEFNLRWLELVDVHGNVCAQARQESQRLHALAKEKGPQRRRWVEEAKKVDGFVREAFHAIEECFLQAMEPLLAAYDARFPEDEWFGIVLADYRACEAYGKLTLQQIIDLG